MRLTSLEYYKKGKNVGKLVRFACRYNRKEFSAKERGKCPSCPPNSNSPEGNIKFCILTAIIGGKFVN